jgi:hypothetical protein
MWAEGNGECIVGSQSIASGVSLDGEEEEEEELVTTAVVVGIVGAVEGEGGIQKQ